MRHRELCGGAPSKAFVGGRGPSRVPMADSRLDDGVTGARVDRWRASEALAARRGAS
jgi:hypothetical protein